jgi:NAD(P)-dependent dehydrogenase (short-subunit alcohol dehydrogenase family)
MAQWTPDDIPDQSGRTFLITGGGSGIGLETARVLIAHHARVILAGRNPAELQKAEKAEGAAGTLVVDLADLASIRKAAAGFDGTVDVLINNAGVMNLPERRVTADGFEMTFGTNHLGHFALTGLLMPALRRSPAARVVTVSAQAANWRRGDLTDLMSEDDYRPMGAYAKSKRANIVFTEELARRLAGTGMSAVVLHPGAARTNLQRHTGGRLMRAIGPVLERLLMGTPQGAAWPSLYAATSDDVHSGDFLGPAVFRDQTAGTPKRLPLPRGSGRPDEGARLWAESERLTGVIY